MDTARRGEWSSLQAHVVTAGAIAMREMFLGCYCQFWQKGFDVSIKATVLIAKTGNDIPKTSPSLRSRPNSDQTVRPSS